MTYLVKYTGGSSTIALSGGQINHSDEWEVIESVCQGSSLVDINKYLAKKKLPLLGNLINFRINGIILVYFVSSNGQLYILDSEHKDCISIVRDFKLKQVCKDL